MIILLYFFFQIHPIHHNIPIKQPSTTVTMIDTFYYYYFIIHIPITVFMDATICIPHEYQLNIQQILSTFHITQNKDFLCAEHELWLQIFVVWELLLQLPFFFYAIYDYYGNNYKFYSRKLWPMFLLYGFSAGFTSSVCLVYVLLESGSRGLNTAEMINLAALYVPTMIIPFSMMYVFWARLSQEQKK